MINKIYIALFCCFSLYSNYVYSNEIEKCNVIKHLISNILIFNEFSKNDLIVLKIHEDDLNCNSSINNPNVKFYKNKELFHYVVEKYITINEITSKKKKCFVNLTIRNGNIYNFYIVSFTILKDDLINMLVKFIKSEPIGNGR